MIRVNKNIARNQYNQGKIIRLIPAKLNFDTKVFQYVYLGKYASTDFDELVDIFKFVYCKGKRGYYPNFYIERI